jgi:hypothetical protein
MGKKNKLVTGLFESRVAASAVVDNLVSRGYDRDTISVLMSDSTKTKEFALENKTHAAEGAGVGGALGGVVGGTIAAIAAVGTSLALPGLGLVIAGPIAAALAGAGAGGAAGGLIGALVGAGIPEHRAKVYEGGLKKGGILIGVEVESDEESKEIEQLFDEVGAVGVREH